MKKTILFIHPGLWSFVECDKTILDEKYIVLPFYYRPGKSIFKNLIMQVRLFLWLISNIWKAQIIFIWFADYHSFLPVLFSKLIRRKSILVLGGYDVVYLPDIKYGAFSNPLRSFCAGFSIQNANYLLPVDASLGKMAIEKLGKVNGKMIAVPTGYDPNEWYCDTPKEDFVLTVGNIKDRQTFLRKGIDFYIEVARVLPQFQFAIIGLNPALILDDIPSNLEIVKKLDRPLLKNYYSRAKVYAQFSIHEGLPNVLCEAMLCECIPVGTAICGIPNGIGDTGYLANTIEEAKTAILKSMEKDRTGEKARKRIIDHFTLAQRKQALFNLLD